MVDHCYGLDIKAYNYWMCSLSSVFSYYYLAMDQDILINLFSSEQVVCRIWRSEEWISWNSWHASWLPIHGIAWVGNYCFSNHTCREKDGTFWQRFPWSFKLSVKLLCFKTVFLNAPISASFFFVMNLRKKYTSIHAQLQKYKHRSKYHPGTAWFVWYIVHWYRICPK